MKTLQTITSKAFTKDILFNKWFLRIGFVVSVLILSLLSYGRAFDYYFWRDDTKVVWMEKHVPALINNFSTLGTARARIGSVLFDYVEYTTLGFNSYPHQFFGFVLRLLNVLLIYFFAKKIFGSKQVAVVTCIFAASFIGGLEAYSWVRGIGLMMSFGLISFISYIHSYERKSITWFIVSLLSASLALSMDIWRTMGIILLISLWEFLHILAKRENASNYLSRKVSTFRLISFLGAQFLVLRLVLIGSSAAGGAVTGSANGYVNMALEGVTWGHFFASLGNLIRTPFLFVQEEGGLTDAGPLSAALGLLLIGTLLFISIRFLIKRQGSLIPWIVLLTWVPLFYGPNWLYSQTLEVASTHRYLAFSALVVPIIWSKLVITKMPARAGFVIILLFVLFGITHAQAVVERDYTIRGSEFVVPIWQTVVNDTPIGETNQLLSVTGDNRIVGYVFAWSDVFPFATFKNIGSPKYLPLYADVKLAAKVLCNPDTNIPDPLTGNFTKAGTNFSIRKAYAWNIKDSHSVNDTSDEFRINIAQNADCLWKHEDKEALPMVHVLKQTIIPQKESNRYSFVTAWQNSGQKTTPIHYVASITEADSLVPLDMKIGLVDQPGSGQISYSHVDFEFVRKPKTTYAVKFFACKVDCTNSHANTTISLDFNDLIFASTRESLQ